MLIRRTDINAHEVAQLYEDGLTAAEIADRFSTCKSLILARLDEAGVERRPKGTKRAEFRFWKKVDKNGPIQFHVPHLGPCWEWQGGTARGKFNYGIFLARGRRIYAHRFAYELEHGSVPESMCVCHSCDNAKCVRGDHLFLGTLADNNHDRTRKGRQARGERMAAAKLSYREADTIRWCHSVLRKSHRRLAREYGVSRSTIWRVLHSKIWRIPAAA